MYVSVELVNNILWLTVCSTVTEERKMVKEYWTPFYPQIELLCHIIKAFVFLLCCPRAIFEIMVAFYKNYMPF
jgi:hypothetical protein